MKKGMALILLLALFSLSGCRYYDTGSDQADRTLEQMIQAIEDQDAASVQAMFAPNAIDSAENMDEMTAALFDFYEGEMISYKRYGPATYESKHGDFHTKRLEASYDVTTSAGNYRIAMQICMIDSSDPENVGMSSFYITKAEDTDTSYAYWGDQLWSPGINVDDRE